MLHRLLRRFVLLGLVVLLEGCIYYRLAQTYRQLCDEPPRIAVVEQEGEGRAIVFSQPTLLDTDVLCLMGAAPTLVEETESGKRWSYVATRVVGADSSTRDAIDVHLDFAVIKGKFRLARATVPPRLEQVLSPRLIDQSIQAACNGELDLLRKTARVDLAGIDRGTLPNRAAVFELFGPPDNPAVWGDALSWSYCLVGCSADDNPRATSRVTVVFDRDGQIEQAGADYLQYSSYANFVAERAVVMFRGSIAKMAWDCGD